MRRGHGSTKVPNVKLRPARKTNKISDVEFDPDATTDTARDALRNDNRPFSGMYICCTGVKDKPALFAKARELGAVCANDFTDITSHLVADAPGSAKYECALKLGIPVLTPEWIMDTHAQWLAGVDIDPDQCVSEHLLPPLKGVVICATRLSNDEDRQRVVKSAVRLGASYQAHLTSLVTHLLIGPDNDDKLDSQKLLWVLHTNKKRQTSTEEEPQIHVVWDSWLLHCAVEGSRVNEQKFAFEGSRARPEPPKDIERVLRRSSKKPAQIYVPASSVNASTNGKEILEKARVRRAAPAEEVWNAILASREGGVPPTQMQAMLPKSMPPPVRVSSASPPVITVDDSATEDEDDESGPSGSRMAPDPPTPVVQGTGPLGTAKATSMVSRLNSLRGSAFEIGLEPKAPIVARVSSLAPSTSPASASPRVFAGKRIAPLGEARQTPLYVALRTHGAITIGEPDESDVKGKGKAKDDALPEEEVDFYIVRLASEHAKNAPALDCYNKYRTDCWVEHCIYEDRLCPPEDNLTYCPLRIDLPVPGAENIKLQWTGLDNEQESAVKRLAKALGIQTTDTFAKRVNTHLLYGSRSGPKYERALQWGVTLVDMDWLYEIARSGRIPDLNGAPATSVPTQRNDVPVGVRTNLGHSSLLGPPNGLLRPAPAKPAGAGEPEGGSREDTTTKVNEAGTSNATANGVDGDRAGQSSGRESGPSSNREGSSTNASRPSGLESKGVEPDNQREQLRNQLADSLGELLKKHQMDENVQTEKPRKRIRPLQRQRQANGPEPPGTSRTRSLSEKGSLISLRAQALDSQYVSPLEAIAAAQEESLQVHYLDPNQHAAKQDLMKLLGDSSQFPEPGVIDIDTQTDMEVEPEPVPIPAKRRRGGGARGASGTRRKSQRKT